jgi:UDP-N-acetylmuramoyl-tripeptide--D-alanyl-D-alanine ligase
MAIKSKSSLKMAFHSTRRQLAKFWLRMHNPLIIGITGSQGKTTTTHTLRHLLPNAIVTDTNLDTLYNVPITALKFRPRHKIGIFELGIDKVNEMDLHLEIVRPKIAIVTGVSAVHSDKEHLGSVANIVKEKSKLIQALPKDGYAILNWDDENVRGMAELTKAKVIFFGTDAKTCQVYFDVNRIELTLAGTSGVIHSELGKDSFLQISTKLIGKHQFYNIAAAYAAFYSVCTDNKQLQHEEIIEKFLNILQTINPLKGRLNFEEGPLGITVLNDSLRANPVSTKAGLEILADILVDARKIAILGEMGELGELAESSHADIGRMIATTKPDYFVCIGPLHKYTIMAAVENGFAEKNAIYAENPLQAAEKLSAILQKGDLVYLKGSLLRHLERVMMKLNGEEVNCNVTSCPFYNRCSNCRYRLSGYKAT